jgi:glycosyltransferase involved in cell wall biosynthesis
MGNKSEKIALFDKAAATRHEWLKKNAYYHGTIENLMLSLVPEGLRVAEIGCGTGQLLNSLKPDYGVGVDFSPGMIEKARENFPHLHFRVEDAEDLKTDEQFDYVIMSDVLGELDDIGLAFRQARKLTGKHTRLVITNYNYLWEPVVRFAEKYKLKMRSAYQHWLSIPDIENLLYLNRFEVVKKGFRTLLPVKIPFLSEFLNKYIAVLPLFSRLCFTEYLVAREVEHIMEGPNDGYSVSVIIPCRNELGNIEDAVRQVPSMGKSTELVFVDGSSTDGTIEKIEEMIEKHKSEKQIKLIHQVPRDSSAAPGDEHYKPPNKMLKLGKGDAVRKGFDATSGDVLMILDSDLTVHPDDLPKFYDALVLGKGELINGSRLVYLMEKDAMRTLNILGNKLFSLVFTWLLDQRIKDTLCGTKVLFKQDYERIKRNRHFFGDFDPFGDFDLLFGAAKLNLKIVEVPVRYRERTYGEIKIERFKHGWLLLKMCIFAMRKIKLI